MGQQILSRGSDWVLGLWRAQSPQLGWRVVCAVAGASTRSLCGVSWTPPVVKPLKPWLGLLKRGCTRRSGSVLRNRAKEIKSSRPAKSKTKSTQAWYAFCGQGHGEPNDGTRATYNLSTVASACPHAVATPEQAGRAPLPVWPAGRMCGSQGFGSSLSNAFRAKQRKGAARI